MSKDRRISRERLEGHPGETYTETVLKPSYDFMLEHYFEALIETNKAWTVMLAEQRIIGGATAKGLLEAIAALEKDGQAGMGEFDPQVEYFYSTMERYLIVHAGENIAGEINIGRTRPEPLVRMVMRERLLDIGEGLLALRARPAGTRRGAQGDRHADGDAHAARPGGDTRPLPDGDGQRLRT
jgi:argininosuccinate lyase